jgi:GNAT superfamily N-acetyltransferase
MAADGSSSREAYLRGFRERLRAMQQPAQEIVDEPGIFALVGSDADRMDGRALVTSDEAWGLLAARLPELFARVVLVFDEAEACRRLLSGTDRHRPTPCTAMVRDHLGSVAAPPLPAGLSRRPISLSPDEDGVPVREAAAVALRSDPTMAPATDLAGFVDYLRSVPHARYLAAVDHEGAVRATAAAATWGGTAAVFFVNTDPDWRGRGVGTAMTAAALRAAVADGAERACLDATTLGRSIYLRLGFEPAGAVTLFVDQR